MRVLVVGGTGPTGPHVVRGLLERGHDTTIFHRGAHEPPELAGVEHIHGDPHFRASIDDALGSRRFDLVIAMYGRLRHLAAALAGRCGRVVGISGVPIYRGYFPGDGCGHLPVPVTEDHPVADDASAGPAARFSLRLAEAEKALFTHHPEATVLRFPMLYGPNNARPHEWSVVRRVRDGRRHMILPDGGLQIHTRCAARNAAAFVLAAIDRPDSAAGQVYNCGDPANWSLREWAETIVRLLGADLEMVAVPGEIAVEAATTLLPLGGTTAAHCVLSTEKARRELGYRPAVDPIEALEDVLAWYETQPDFDAAAYPSFTDRFDYETEDALIAEYRAGVRRAASAVRQRPAAPVHSMPHPRTPGTVDHRGR
ncbi:epimerase [Actinomadura sp. LD22]|uniref:Epimerase n=2 Tax=Actinomadura physcomitrii TaxID=2650748 RepID=A0A6I4MG49_9ACTN|nr:epimerase [Actinomadura physcomitrii]